MKKSLGRRSSSRNPPRSTPFTEFGSAVQDRKSGIPVRRDASSDRNLSKMATPLSRNVRATSEDRNSMITSSARSQGFGGGTERPSRATTLSTNSARHSSYGGARSKMDTRPLDDKGWQLDAQKRIEGFLIQDPEGCHLLQNGSIKPITLKIFISVIDLLLRRLDGNNERTYIHKDNYITELPFIMKKLLYRGKIEKSWLITVNTNRSWGHVLGCIDFLVSCVTSQMVIDPVAVMFPEIYDKVNEDFWDYKVLLPYFNKSYALFRTHSDDPDYAEIQQQYDREVIDAHVSNDNVYDRIKHLECDIKRVRHETEAMKMQLMKVQQSSQNFEETYKNLKQEKAKYVDFFGEYNRFIEETNMKSDNMDRTLEKLMEELERHKKKKAEIEKAIANQQLSHTDIAELKQRRDSLQREVKRVQDYITTYEELVHQNSLEVLTHKKKIEDLIKKYNIEVIKYLPYNFECTLDIKLDEEEIVKRLSVVQDAVKSAKNGIQSLMGSDPKKKVQQIQNEISNLDKKLNDKQNKMKLNEEKGLNIIREKEEAIRKMKNEMDSINEKLIHLKIDPELQHKLDEKLELADKMEKQLEILKKNVLYITTECLKIKEEYFEKNQALEEQYRQKFALM